MGNDSLIYGVLVIYVSFFKPDGKSVRKVTAYQERCLSTEAEAIYKKFLEANPDSKYHMDLWCEFKPDSVFISKP